MPIFPLRLFAPLVAALSAFAAFGCATIPPPPPTPGVEQISYRRQTPPFCGRCDAVDLVVVADGTLWIETGHWGGFYQDWRRTRRLVRSTPAQFAAFKERLAPYRPDQDVMNGEESCKNVLTDNDGAVIEWWDGHERRVRVFDFGCLDDRRMNEAIRDAPSLLPGVPLEGR